MGPRIGAGGGFGPKGEFDMRPIVLKEETWFETPDAYRSLPTAQDLLVLRDRRLGEALVAGAAVQFAEGIDMLAEVGKSGRFRFQGNAEDRPPGKTEDDARGRQMQEDPARRPEIEDLQPRGRRQAGSVSRIDGPPA